MSRAFIKENDDDFDELPERPISTAPNWVTEQGLAQINAEIEQLNTKLLAVGDNRAERARIGRDLRYWTARRGSAHLMPAPTDTEIVRFGAVITIDREDGRRETFQIVGEDEADPTRGTLSHTAPLARALLGKSPGDVVRINDTDIELVEIALSSQ